MRMDSGPSVHYPGFGVLYGWPVILPELSCQQRRLDERLGDNAQLTAATLVRGDLFRQSKSPIRQEEKQIAVDTLM
jgi:hypothetical protein